ncbi:MAG: winged helix-turn-helix transcriptional regulator [Acidobacteria bacterium]|nr:MAG: winged helix-turn-helix transcriptional regulator [Acidobacteriota bacterium]
METVLRSASQIPLTQPLLRQLHRDLFQYTDPDLRPRRSAPASPRLAELLSWLDEQHQSHRLHPLLTIAVFLAVFLDVRPFPDGNARRSRILTTHLLLRAGYAYVPYASLDHEMIEGAGRAGAAGPPALPSRSGSPGEARRGPAPVNDRQLFFESLRQTQTTFGTQTPNWRPWLEAFLRALLQQKRRLSVKLEREKNALADLSPLAVKILDYARDQGRVTNRAIARESAASPNTLKATFTALVAKGLLTRHAAGRSTWYSLP